MKNLLLLFFLVASVCMSSQSTPDLIIKDANILSMTNSTVVMNKSVAVKNGKILQIDDFNKIKKDKNCKVIEAKGKFLMPGLAEMHSHLPDENKADTVLLRNVAAGVTHLRVMNADLDQVALKKRLESNDKSISPKLHYSFILTKDNKYTEAQFDSLMLEIKKSGLSFIKLFSIANEETFDNLMNSANKNKVIVCGHFPGSINIEKVIYSGFKSIEHVGGLDKIRDSSALLISILHTKEKEVFNCPTLDWDIMACNLQYPREYKHRLIYYNAPKHYLHRWETEYNKTINETGQEKILATKEKYLPSFKNKEKILKALYENNCLLIVGSDPGGVFQMEGFNMYEEMLNWSKAGIDNYTILKSATTNPALFFNEQDKWGTIEIGKDADMIILRKNPLEDIINIRTIETTILNGNIYKKTDLLKKM
ncbi:MAG: amidohydrolase family protein [Bacteroidota bacterium]|nr:amidohydrolase family protein [Bacteroidota bacterium]